MIIKNLDQLITKTPDDSLEKYSDCEFCGKEIHFNDRFALVLDDATCCEDCVLPYMIDEQMVKYIYAEKHS